MNNKINDIYEELLTLTEDLRAEVVASELVQEEGLDTSDILVTYAGAFSRAYKKDLLNTGLKNSYNASDLLQLELSRNGIYDVLPEGVFHKEVKDVSLDYETSRKEQKQEEKAARSLFAPIENEVFFQRVAIEHKSADIIKGFGNLNSDFLIDLWKIDKTIPKKYSIRLVKLLPYAHKIAGDLPLTFQCLEKILETPVSFKKQFKKRLVTMPMTTENRLGLDFVLHQEKLEIQQPFLEITLHPINKTLVEDFIGDTGLNTFLALFYQYFLPIEYELETRIEMVQKENFILGDQEGTFMGMTTRL